MQKVYIEDAAHNRVAEVRIENRNVKVVLLRKGYSVRMDDEKPDNVIEVGDSAKSEEKIGQ